MRGHGEGSIQKRGDGYLVQVSGGTGPDGKRVRRSATAPTRREAKKVREELQAQVNAGLTSTPTDTVGTLLERWVTARDVRPTTRAHYEYVIGHLAPLHAVKAEALSPLMVDGVLAKAGSPRLRQMMFVVLRAAFKWARVKRLVSQDPMPGVERPRVAKKEVAVWDKGQVRAFLDSRPDPLFVVALYTGLRQGELLGLEWGDVDLAARTLTVRRTLIEIKGKVVGTGEPKTESGRRTVSLPGPAVEALVAIRELGGLVFKTSNGTHLLKSNVTRSFKRACQKAGVPKIRFHDLRHCHATLLLAAGENVKVVSKRLGHSSVQVTLDVYAHVMAESDRDAGDRLAAILS